MKNPVWAKAIRESADPQRAQHSYDLLSATAAVEVISKADPEQARVLCALFSGSPVLSAWLAAHPERLPALAPDLLKYPRRQQGFRREVETWLTGLLKKGAHGDALARLRQFKQGELLRIGARDLAHLANQSEITRELSDVADVCLEGVWRICAAQLREQLGQPFHRDAAGGWRPTPACVIGLGKLGGQELNYSSDVDVMFVYAEDGAVFKKPPTRGGPGVSILSSQQFFNRLAEKFIAEVSRLTGDGALYRIDLRLRPEGEAGPLTRSLAGCETYYAQWGQTWERMMLIKARGVAGDAALAAEFIEVIQPFRYPRSLGDGVLREVAAIKDRIENEVVRSGELDRNVKLGRGGIREIEFVAQTFQLLQAGHQPFLQGAQTLPVIKKLEQYGLLPRADAGPLVQAYDFLRDVEHRLQMEEGLQTHTIPVAPAARHRLARLMGFDVAEEFETARQEHCVAVRRVYDRFLRSEPAGPASGLPLEIPGRESEWKDVLARYSFRQPDQGLRLLREFAYGPGYVHVSNRTTELAFKLVHKFLSLCPPAGNSPAPAEGSVKVLSDPDRVLTRLASFIEAYGARATLFDLWTHNPSLFELMLWLFDRSEFLAEAAIRTPDLVDALVLGGRLRQRKAAVEILRDLRHGRKDPDQKFWLRRYHQAELMRIGLRDILGVADFEQNLVELTALAEACLQYALETVLRRHRLSRARIAIIGLGKLGGAELNYGSDLDILFVTDAPASVLPKLQPVAVEIMDLVSTRTEQGSTFVTDARLRPDGDKGLLVNNLAAYKNYYERRARLWEIQALTRARPVAGDAKLGQRFGEWVARVTDFSKKTGGSGRIAKTEVRKRGADSVPDWRKEIHEMRSRIERERTPKGQDALAIKTGAGGLMDAEFLAQYFALIRGWHEPNTLRSLEKAQEQKALSPADAARLIDGYRQLRRVEGILRRWSLEGETVLPSEDAPFQRVAIRCGFATPAEFRAALAQWRGNIRAVYEKAMRAE